LIVRHRTAGGTGPWLGKHWKDVAMCLERLAGKPSAQFTMGALNLHPSRASYQEDFSARN
jgi:hypothetical protein